MVIKRNLKFIFIQIHQKCIKNPRKIWRSYLSKVDDMLMQYLVTKRKSPIAIVTDSIADLPSSYLLEHQVHCLPINILSDNQVF